MKILFSSLILLFCLHLGVSQVGRVDQQDRLQYLLDRYEVKYGNYEGFMGLNPKFRTDVFHYFSGLDSVGLSSLEDYDRQLVLNNLAENSAPIYNDSNSWWKKFYENRAYAFSLKKGNFWISANPILYLKGGIEQSDNYILQNTRGIEIKGSLGQKIYFATTVHENQASFLNHHRKRINQFKSIPGQSLYKDFNFNIDNQSYDYLNSDGYVGLRINKFTAIELGHGRQFIGHGIRSVLLSDYATNYFYLRANTKVWKFNYQNLFAEIAPFSPNSDLLDLLLPKKYFAQHLLSFKAHPKLELGIMETIVFTRQNYFELQYLNPFIFYRTVEQFLGSPDNAMIGLQMKWNVIPGVQFYGQALIDEFNIGELRDNFWWHGNTIALQGGLKIVDLLKIDHLDLQLEANVVRPYTYSHTDTIPGYAISQANYSHSSQPLAHPLGANFFEFIAQVNYKPSNRININPRFVFAQQGVESSIIPGTDGFNLGSNILLDRSRRAGDDDQQLLQGKLVTVQQLTLNASYDFFQNYFCDINIQYRNSVSEELQFEDQSLYFGAAIRMNFSEPYRDY